MEVVCAFIATLLGQSKESHILDDVAGAAWATNSLLLIRLKKEVPQMTLTN